MNKTTLKLISFIVVLSGILSCSSSSDNSANNSSGPTGSEDAYPPWGTINIDCLYCLADFDIGTVVAAHLGEGNLFERPDLQAVANQHFNFIIPGYIMSQEIIRPEENRFNFFESDMLLAYTQANGQSMHSSLLWHLQVPEWMHSFSGDWSAMMENHIHTIVSRYAGQIQSWTVVNEAFDDNIPPGLRQSVWQQNVGDDYVAQAFSAARAADPNAELYYNEYMFYSPPDKFNAVVNMIEDFKARSIPIDGLGLQMHILVDWPSLDEIRDMLNAAVGTGLKVRLSELELFLNYHDNHSELTLDLALQQEQRYREIVRLYMELVPIAQRGGIVIWGINDAESHAQVHEARQDWPLLLDEYMNQKPAMRGFADGLTTQ